MYPIVTLKSGRQDAVLYRHPWVYSGALDSGHEKLSGGDLVRVADHDKRVLGVATYSRSSIALRMLAFDEREIDQAFFVQAIGAASSRRALLGYGEQGNTTGYRLVFGEADGLPGLVIDRYADVLVFQLATAGMDRLRGSMVSALQELFPDNAIVERSDIEVRTEERLAMRNETVGGEVPDKVRFDENGLHFAADVLNGQKTGFYLDQKDLRQLVRRYSDGRTVLNCFSYTGATGVYALAGGAKSVLHVDSSAPALLGCLDNAKLNQVEKKTQTHAADVFTFLQDDHNHYDMVILDPPGLIKDARSVENGRKAYHFLNRSALRKITDGGLLITSSCSHFLPEEDFVHLLRRAAVQAGKKLHLLHRVYQSPDHPLSIYFPEGLYLKSLVFQVESYDQS